MDKLYALCPINVGGTEYKPGEEIECGDGARASLLRCGQASTKEPTMSAEEPTPTPESQDELTALSELGLEEQVIEKLQENNMRSIEELFAYIDGGKKLRKLDCNGGWTW